MQTLDLLVYVKKILLFLFGTPHEAMYGALTAIVIGIIIDYIRDYDPPKGMKKISTDVMRNLMAYIAFVIIATRLDAIAVDAIMNWEGATQSLACLFIVSREIKNILDYIRSRGIEIPKILESRVNHISKVADGPASTQEIEKKLTELKQQIAEIESKRQSNNNNEGGGVG